MVAQHDQHNYCVGLLIAGLRLAEVRPLTEWVLLIGWPCLILVSV